MRLEIDFAKIVAMSFCGENADVQLAKAALRYGSKTQNVARVLLRASYELQRELHPETRGEDA